MKSINTYTRPLPCPAVSLCYVCARYGVEYAGYLMTFPEFSSCLCISLCVCTVAKRACYRISDPRNLTPPHAEMAWCRLLPQRLSMSNAVRSSKHVLTCQPVDPTSVQMQCILFCTVIQLDANHFEDIFMGLFMPFVRIGPFIFS